MLDFTDRVAVITGGAQGIGLAAARIISAGGGSIVILDTNEESAEDAVDDLKSTGGRALFIKTDVSVQSQVAAAFVEAQNAYGRVDILINNAGITGPASPVWEIPPDYFERLLQVHVMGAYYCIVEAVPRMLEQDYGRIVNVSSVAGKEGNAGSGGYSAAKAGLIGLTKSLGKELATTSVLVNAVTPGVILTDLGKRDGATPEHIDRLVAKIPMGRMGRPEEVGELIAFAASDRVTFTTASVFDASGGRSTY